ncbi:MAG TPA: prevent-host-death family protein [Mycobacteriales bacterium]|nr:prevent-host-death family protein [Mycobacteriales bacterium]
MTELPEDELREHPDEVLRRVKSGEEFVLTEDGQPVAELRPSERRRSVSWDEFMSWPKADPKMLDDIRELRGSDEPEDWQDPWERYERRDK